MDHSVADVGDRRPAQALPYHYRVYGIEIASDRALDLPRHAHDALCAIECVSAPAAAFEAALHHVRTLTTSDPWHCYAAIADGASYVRWATVGEFLVQADGRRILCRRAEPASEESFQVYLLGQALALALVTQQFEPLHATVVVVDGQAVAFLGASAFGKSTLAAGFVAAGHRLLTDDLLVVQESEDGVLAYPGPPRIKLFPHMAARILRYADPAPPMNAHTDKRIVPVDPRLTCPRPVALQAIYAIRAPREACRDPRVSIEPTTVRQAFIELLKGSFNRQIRGAARRARQLRALSRIADRVPVRTLSYPRDAARLVEVRDAVLADLATEKRRTAPALAGPRA